MAKLVLTAENFAFGPIGKLLNVADLLKEQGHTMIFVGFGTALQLAKNFPFHEIYEVDTDNSSSNKKLETIIAKADIVISSMDIPSVNIAKRLGKPVVWIDCLFWFWDAIPEQVLEADIYFRERSMEDSSNEQKYESKIKNLSNVGPILPRLKPTKRVNQVLISYGGGEASYWYKAGLDTNYPCLMTDILLKKVDWTQFDRVILASNERIAKDLAQKFTQSPFEFICLPYEKFLTELLKSEIILITPGLVTSQAAFASGTPTLFLPASNNSQYLQLEEFRERGLAPASVQLSDFMSRLDLRGKPLRESTQEILKQLREFEQSPNIQARVGDCIRELIHNRREWSADFVSNGRKFIESLGGNGAQVVADKIAQLLVHKGLE